MTNPPQELTDQTRSEVQPCIQNRGSCGIRELQNHFGWTGLHRMPICILMILPALQAPLQARGCAHGGNFPLLQATLTHAPECAPPFNTWLHLFNNPPTDVGELLLGLPQAIPSHRWTSPTPQLLLAGQELQPEPF